MFNNITNFLNLIVGRKIKTAATIENTDLIPLGTKDPNFVGGYQPTAIEFDELKANIIASVPPPPPSGVQSVTGLDTDNTDPLNPVVQISVDGTTITGDGTPASPLVASFQSPAVDGVTITGDGTPGNPLVAVGGGGGAVNYANVFFVDSTNGNNATAVRNDFTKPYSEVNPFQLQVLLPTLPATANDRVLIYVRRGNYFGNNITFYNYVDYYFEPGTVLTSFTFADYGNSRECKVFGKAVINGSNFAGAQELLRITAPASKIYFEFDEINVEGSAIGIFGGSSATIVGRKIYSQTFGTGYGITLRGSGTIVINVTEEIAAWHNVITPRTFSGKAYITCPRLYLDSGNYYGGNFKAVVHVYDNLGGEITINGDLIVNSAAGYYGGTSAVITRWTDSWLTLRVKGNIFAENQFGVYGLGSSAASRTIINGDVRTNNLIAYTASNSSVVFRNGTLMNWNTYTGSEGYPVLSVGGNGKYFVDNCQMYSLGVGATYPNIAAFWKDTTTSEINVYNTTHSGSDAPGFFIRNSAPGQPVNNVRIHNCRSSKKIDTNITDLLSPTGFIEDPNTLALNFI
jgi:hypothetical protein